jgi:hypothetical protein
MHGLKLSNEYARIFGPLYEQTPKAVFAAIALSFAFMDIEEAGWEQAVKRVLKEWQTLHANGIVPQGLPKL